MREYRIEAKKHLRFFVQLSAVRDGLSRWADVFPPEHIRAAAVQFHAAKQHQEYALQQADRGTFTCVFTLGSSARLSALIGCSPVPLVSLCNMD